MTRKYFLSLFTLTLLLLSSSALGQDGDYPKVEAFGGFSWIEIDGVGGEDERFNGWQASISGNFHENIGIVVDVGGRYRSFVDFTTQSYEFLVGPRFTTLSRTARYLCMPWLASTTLVSQDLATHLATQLLRWASAAV